MPKPTKILLKRVSLFISISVTFGIFYLSLIKIPESKIDFRDSDKILHLLAYFTLTTSWLFLFYKKQSLKYFVTIACIIYGIIIEILQEALTANRSGDYKDALANTLGVILGLIVFNKIFWLYSKL